MAALKTFQRGYEEWRKCDWSNVNVRNVGTHKGSPSLLIQIFRSV